jgi:MFS family permease
MPKLSSPLARPTSRPESPYAWARLAAGVLSGTIGSVGIWSVVVALPTVQADFGITRADASLAYTLTMAGFAGGGVLAGRLADRFGIVGPVVLGVMLLSAGFLGSAYAANALEFALFCAMIGLGSSATFAPLIADISHWFTRRRGIAVAVCASGNYLGGAIWPPIVEHLIAGGGWRGTQMIIAAVCLVTMLPIALALRRRVAQTQAMPAVANTQHAVSSNRLDLSPNALQGAICLAGLACCIAMSMPQVHIVAYCSDLGFGVARGAEMLSAMLGFGIVSRIASGFIADRIGGLATLLWGSALQGVALSLYLLFDGLTPLYVISALFGLFQGGIVPMYAIIVREAFPEQEAGARVGLAIMSTIVGMAVGGWMSGALFDLTGTYWSAFMNGIAWNLVNTTVVGFLLWRGRRRVALA